MSETPETDEAQFGTGRVSVDFARRLERERDEARGKLSCEIAMGAVCIASKAYIDGIHGERDKLKAINAELLDALERYETALEDGPENCSYARYEECSSQAIAAINKAKERP